MQPPVAIQDREAYKQQMDGLLEIDPASTVALTIDMQRDYLDASIATAPVPQEQVEGLIGRTAKLLDACRGLSMPVVHCYVKRRPIEPASGFDSSPAFARASKLARLSQHPDAPARTAPDRVDGTDGWKLPEALLAPGDVHVDTKRVMDSFFQTDLDMLLGRALRPRTLLIAGINADTCVHATTFAAAVRGYAPVVVSDCVDSYRGPDHRWMALELMSRTIAWVMPLDDVLAKLATADATR